MPYELRAKGRTVQTFDTEDEGVAGARELIGLSEAAAGKYHACGEIDLDVGLSWFWFR